jgi:hypothetical protein
LTTAFTFTGRLDAREDALDREVDVVHCAERRIVDRVEADGHAPQPRSGQRRRLLRQQGAVRRQCQVERVDRGEPCDQDLEIAAEERLAAGDPHLLHTVCHERPRHAVDLFEGQELLAVHEAVPAAEHLLGHAIDAAEVAAVRDRDPQVAERAAERVERVHTPFEGIARRA